MDVGAGLCMYDVVVKKFTFATSSPDEFLVIHVMIPGHWRFHASASYNNNVMKV